MIVALNRWYAILTADEVRPGRGTGARRLGHDLVFWRGADGQVHGALDRCPHRGAKLSPGKVKDGCIECPFHGFLFDGAGTCTAIPAHPERRISAAMSLAPLPLREAHGFVWLWTGPEAAPDGEIPFFDFEGFSWQGSQLTVPVETHYTRAIENQLDFAHLPFVHASTIGRFATAEVEVNTAVDGDRIRADVGQPDGFIDFLGPNLWRLRTGPTWQFLVFVPIDEGRMQYYMRNYQPWVHAPGLRWMVGRANAVVNRMIIGQDTPVVESQPAEETRLRMDEVLVPSDQPIIAYRRWREAHRGEWQPPARRPSRVALAS